MHPHPALRTAAGEQRETAEAGGEKLRVLRALPPALRALAELCAAPALRPQLARAYCGPAHQQEWTLDGGPLPECVDVSVEGCPQPYRLVRHPTTGEPARDRRGALVFVPARHLLEEDAGA